ncbi:hypothetical protein Hanom_Chr09g00842811 [Helianthus anomalus]
MNNKSRKNTLLHLNHRPLPKITIPYINISKNPYKILNKKHSLKSQNLTYIYLKKPI